MRPRTIAQFGRFWPSNDLYTQLATLQSNDIEDLTITSVSTRSELTRQVQKYIVRSVQVRRGGEWMVADRRHPIIARAGSTLRIRAVLSSYRNLLGTRTVRVDVAVPERVRFADGSLDVMGGDFFGGEDFFGMEFVGYPGEFGFGEQQPTTVGGLIAQIKRAPTHDQVVASLTLFRRNGSVTTRESRVTADAVVTGGLSVPVYVFGPRR